MKKPALSQMIKIAFMTLTVLAVALLGLVGGAWSQVALADDPPGTIPEQQGVAGPLLEETETPEPGDCGEGLDTDTTPAFVGDSLLRILEIKPGHSQLLNSTGAASFSADTVEPEQLPASPIGYDLLSCGILTSGQSVQGGPIALFRSGPFTCFPIPPGYVVTIFYFDPSPEINRWVKLVTLIDDIDNEACTSLRLPALLALFGIPVLV